MTATLTVTGVHPYADKFPMIREGEFAELVESIRASGLRQPVVVTPDGLILDGRNRFAACTALGIEAERVIYDGDDLAEYVIDANSSRRHMSTGARAMATAMVLVADGRRDGGKWSYGAVAMSQRSESGSSGAQWKQRLAEAGVILDHRPDLAAAVVSGDLALDAAYRQAEERRDRERNKLAEQERLAVEEADARAFIEEQAPDLAEQVATDGPFRSFGEARDVWNRRNREEAARIKAEKAAQAKRAAEEREARSQQYSGIARGLQICGGYGQYEDIPKLMAGFDPAELNPPQYEREFTPENLRYAARFATELIKWAEARQ